MGIEDRDWYWKARARRNSPDDDYFLKRDPASTSTAPAQSRTTAAVLVVVALLVVLFAVAPPRAWFAYKPAPDPAKVAAELEALRRYDQQGYQSRPPPIVHPRHPYVASRAHAHSQQRRDFETGVGIGLIVLAVASPFVLLALLIALFFRRARGLAAAGLLYGLIGSVAGAWGGRSNTGIWFWLTAESDGIGSVIELVARAAGTFVLAAAIAVIVGALRRNVRGGSEPIRVEAAAQAQPEVQATVAAPAVVPAPVVAPTPPASRATTVASPDLRPPAANWALIAVGLALVIVLLAWLESHLEPSNRPFVRFESIPITQPQQQQAAIPLQVQPVPPGASESRSDGRTVTLPAVTGAIIHAPYQPDWQAIPGGPAGSFFDRTGMQRENDDVSINYLFTYSPPELELGVVVARKRGRSLVNCARGQLRRSQAWSYGVDGALAAQTSFSPWTPPLGAREEALVRFVCGGSY